MLSGQHLSVGARRCETQETRQRPRVSQCAPLIDSRWSNPIPLPPSKLWPWQREKERVVGTLEQLRLLRSSVCARRAKPSFCKLRKVWLLASERSFEQSLELRSSGEAAERIPAANVLSKGRRAGCASDNASGFWRTAAAA